MTADYPTYKFGRLPRAFDPKVPHLSALIAGKSQSPPPRFRHWGHHMPANLGVMLNNRLQNCTCAAFYHALQVWSFNTGERSAAKMLTPSDAEVEKLYQLACGYDPNQPGEGPGGRAQHVLKYLFNHGAPIGQHERRNRIVAYIEVDPRHLDDVKRAINDCGVVYIGFHVPGNLGPEVRHLPDVWDVDSANRKIVGGHAVVSPGYDEDTLDVISWGRFYRMTWDFFSRYVEEIYAIADKAWVESTRKTPGGLTLGELEEQMSALRDDR
ncbi:MAG: hypothetical protein JO271_12480 [Verrucomicrobia bacterium]|nr:hypothetical protein [Verrucomicrobiota bacterium]